MHGTASLSLARRCHATGAFRRRCLTIVVVLELAHCGAPYVLEDDMPEDGLVTPMPEQLSDGARLSVGRPARATGFMRRTRPVVAPIADFVRALDLTAGAQ